MARNVGYEGVEFLPTWRFVWEMKRYGKLLAPEGMVASGHRDWRFDRVMQAINEGKPSWLYQFKTKGDLLFPPSSLCREALQQFQKVYRVAVSTIHFNDTKNFSPVMLEIINKRESLGYIDLMEWLREDPKNRGVVLDTDKISLWLEDNNLADDKDRIISELIPFTSEIHYRSFLERYPGRQERSGKNLQTILSLGFKGRVVVEFGWPDMENSPFGLFKEDLNVFKKIHKRLIAFVRNF